VSLKSSEEALRAEAEVLRCVLSLSPGFANLQPEICRRAHPAPPPILPRSTALSELSLAHRRLSAKLDLTEQQLNASQLELATAKQENSGLYKETEGDRATINDLRRVDKDRDEEIEWERGERRKMEEQKKLW